MVVAVSAVVAYFVEIFSCIDACTRSAEPMTIKKADLRKLHMPALV
jgi:hypothetical protein